MTLTLNWRVINELDSKGYRFESGFQSDLYALQESHKVKNYFLGFLNRISRGRVSRFTFELIDYHKSEAESIF